MKLLLLPALACALAAPTHAAPLIEAESALQARQVLGGDLVPDRKLTGWGGACLGNGWGGAIGHWARFDARSSGGLQVLHLRYARASREGEPDARLRVSIEGGASSDVVLPATGEWDLWRWIAIPVGPVAAGACTLRLESLAPAALNLDALALSPEAQAPPEVLRRLLFEAPIEKPGDKLRLRVQLGPDAANLDGEKLLARAQVTFDFLSKYLGEQPSGALTVNIIGPEQAGRDFIGHSNGHEMYLEAARAHDTSHNWVHEMTHCFQREAGSWPTWLSEGEAWLAYYHSESALWQRPPAEIRLTPAFFRERLPQYREALLVDGRSLLQRWGQPDFPSQKVGAAYGFANFILGELSRRFGPDLMKKYRALLREDYAEGKRDAEGSVERRDAAVVGRLGRAAGEDLRPLFESWGFRLGR